MPDETLPFTIMPPSAPPPPGWWAPSASVLWTPSRPSPHGTGRRGLPTHLFTMGLITWRVSGSTCRWGREHRGRPAGGEGHWG